MPIKTIAVASGKGGTGKTTVAVHIANESAKYRKTILVDLDVEAPDSMAYFPGARRINDSAIVEVGIPKLAPALCDGCGICAKACRFGALLALGGVLTIDSQICKGCGRCEPLCPHGALTEAAFPVGEVSLYRDDRLTLAEGRLKIGDIRSTQVIEETKRIARSRDFELEIRDCPPGVTCPTTHAVHGADYLILVAEPTEFSHHDLEAALRLAREMKVTTGIVINKEGFGMASLEDLAAQYGVPIIGRIKFSREKAQAGAITKMWSEDPVAMEELGRILDFAIGASAAEVHNQ